MMFDLIGQVAGHEGHHRSGIDVGAAKHLAQVPVALTLAVEVREREFVGAVREMAAEDHRVGPDVADEAGHQVGLHRRAEAGPRRQRGQRRVGEVVLDHLASGLRAELPNPGHRSGPCLGTVEGLAQLQVLQADAPLEAHREHGVEEQVPDVVGPPRFIAGHAQNSVADVVVHAEDVGVGVVGEVVGGPPVLGGCGHVPFPGGGMDLGIIHPVPLAVNDVVTDLHVLDDLGQREGSGAGQPGRSLRSECQQ